MKKIIVLILALVLIFGIVDCSNKVNDNVNKPNSETEKADENFQNLIEWEKNYKSEHPNATDEEVEQAFDEAFDEAFAGLDKWVTDYKIAHPNATDEEVNQAFKDLWAK